MTIPQRIQEIQRGRRGIYPYRVSWQISLEFSIPIKDAMNAVCEHIKTEIAASMTESRSS
jgi:hypothetical protein